MSKEVKGKEWLVDELKFMSSGNYHKEWNRAIDFATRKANEMSEVSNVEAENALNNHYLYDLKEEIAYLREQGPGKAKSLDMLECMIDKMLPNEWEPTCFKKEKVKVKKFVVEWLIHCENRGYSLYGAMITTNEMSDEMKLWLVESSNQLMFVKAYEYGYEVEEEPKYYVAFPALEWNEHKAELETKYMYLLYDGTSDETNFSLNPRKFKDFVPELTEGTIKALDERFWAFAVPVEEVTNE